MILPSFPANLVHWAGCRCRGGGVLAESGTQAGASQSTYRYKSPALRSGDSDSIRDH